MVGVLLVEVVIWLWLQLGRQFFENCGEDCIDGFLVGPGAVPDGYQVGVEANGETNACELVAWLWLDFYSSFSFPQLRS